MYYRSALLFQRFEPGFSKHFVISRPVLANHAGKLDQYFSHPDHRNYGQNNQKFHNHIVSNLLSLNCRWILCVIPAGLCRISFRYRLFQYHILPFLLTHDYPFDGKIVLYMISTEVK